jgi:hypothetical protein
MFSTALVLGVASIIVALCFSGTEQRKSKYLTAGMDRSEDVNPFIGLPLIFGLIFFFPFTLLLSLRLEGEDDMEWAYIFIPLFVADGFFICISAFLLLFTVGSRDSALFTIGQITSFLCGLPTAIVFKVLLVLSLDGRHLPLYHN